MDNYEYTQEMRAEHKPCPLCGTWHTSQSCPPQFVSQSAQIQILARQIQEVTTKLNELTEENRKLRIIIKDSMLVDLDRELTEEEKEYAKHIDISFITDEEEKNTKDGY